MSGRKKRKGRRRGRSKRKRRRRKRQEDGERMKDEGSRIMHGDRREEKRGRI